MDMNLQKYMALVKTVEYGSFTKAAEMLNYSQSGISRMINDLEKEWKVTLLERGRSGVRPTSDGMKILPYAENVCREYEKLQMQVEELNGLRSGLIRIGAFSSVASQWLPNIIREFQKDYPNIDYELLLGECSLEDCIIHLEYNGQEKEISGGEANTTNNRMELMAFLSALKLIDSINTSATIDVSIMTDSSYISNALNLGWYRT